MGKCILIICVDPVMNIQILKDQFVLVFHRFACWPSEYCQTLRLTFLNEQRYHLWDFPTAMAVKSTCMYLWISDVFFRERRAQMRRRCSPCVCRQSRSRPQCRTTGKSYYIFVNSVMTWCSTVCLTDLSMRLIMLFTPYQKWNNFWKLCFVL